MRNIFLSLKSVRPLNLLIMALTMYLVRYCLILPAYEIEFKVTGIFPLHISEEYFFLLVLSTMMIAAAGYMLNDSLDSGIDSINKPDKKSFAALVSRTAAINIFIIINSVAILISFFLAESINNLLLGGVQVTAVALLALYSGYLKKILLLGNISVALLSAMVPVLAGLYEPSFYLNFDYIFIYAGFAFLISLTREIIKDAEDEEGDKAAGRKTIPIVLGMSTTKVVLSVLVLITATAGGKLLANYFYGYAYISFWKIVACFEIPFALLFILIVLAKTKKDFSRLSAITKVVMLLGILTMIPLYYFFLK
ncbi:MAG TPA: geranylgeranylglycerol-phosphate geranylgeranyltransferase [Bacteroidia bacterium]|nr:geranylgeranylglycerol-phosphate geranylgeranyltransferase [Bacteroidia bacterium]